MKLCVRLFLLLAVLVFAFLSISLPSVAQSTATLFGRITDRSGATIADAEISAEDLSHSGPSQQSKSAADGSFSLALAPGKYRIRVTSSQMAPLAEEIALSAGERRQWNVRMELAELSSTVVVTAQAEPESANTVASPVTVLTRQEIEQRQEIWLAPLLASAPGVSLSPTDPSGGLTGMFLDGGNPTFTKILVDGTPINEPGGRIDLSNLDLSSIDKVEVVHGASSALFGSDAMTGVVQIFTHRGTTAHPEVTLTAEGGSFGTGSGAADLSGKLNRFDYASSISYFNGDGQVPNDRFRDRTLSGNFGWKFSDTDNLRLSLRSAASDAGLPGQTLDPQIGEPYPCLISSADLHDFSSDLSWDFSTGSHWEHHIAGTESYDRRFDVNEFCSPGNFAEQFNRSGFDEQSTYLFGRGGASLGYDYEVENGSAGGPHVRRNNQGGYLETHYQFGRRLMAIAGARAEANAAFGTRVVPRGGLNFVARYGGGFWESTRLRASYGLGIKEPEFFQSFSSDPCFPGNPNLRPERSKTFDAGIDQVMDSEHLRFSGTFFANNFHDMVSFAFAPASASCPFGTGTFFNTDKSRAYGANATIEAKPLSWLSVVGNYTYDDSRVLQSPNASDPAEIPGNRLLLRPLHSGDLILNAAFHRMNWNLAGYYVGRTTDSDFLGLGFTTLPGYIRVDLGTQFLLSHGVTAIAHVGNLLNRHYQGAIGYPALRLNYRAGLKYTWGGR
jgi:outer membrane cobalamin receptor